MDDFRPTRFGQRLWVCPVGQSSPDPNAVVVDLDPGLAFGTGHHPTTALCLEWLDGADLAGRTLLDYGCGSGILAIAALKLGAARALAVDHDPQALEATRDNARANGVAERIWAGSPAELDGIAGARHADLVVANILAGPLVELAPSLLACLRPGGALALSGVLADQVDSVQAAYAGSVHLGPTRLRDDWALISGFKEPHPLGRVTRGHAPDRPLRPLRSALPCLRPGAEGAARSGPMPPVRTPPQWPVGPDRRVHPHRFRRRRSLPSRDGGRSPGRARASWEHEGAERGAAYP